MRRNQENSLTDTLALESVTRYITTTASGLWKKQGKDMDSGAMLSFGGVIIATFLASVGLFWRIFARTEDKLDCLDRRLSRIEGKKESEATVTELIVKKYLEQ